MLSEAQSTMRRKYINGGPGVIVSGLVWLLAAAVTVLAGFRTGMIVFFAGGVMIHPVSVLIAGQMEKQPPQPDKGLTRLSLLTLPLLFGGLYLAYLMSQQNEALFYPVMSIAIGLRYLIFQRVYGLNTFFTLGAALIVIGSVAYFASPKLYYVPIIVGLAEIIAGIFLTMQKTTRQ